MQEKGGQMITISSSQVKNTFGEVLDKSQKEAVSVTKHGRVVSIIMSLEVLQDYIDGYMATEAQKNGMLTAEESKLILDRYR